MPNFNGRSYLLGTLYNMRGNFSHLWGFVRQFTDHFKSLPYEREAVLAKVQQLRQEYSRVRGPIGEEEAFKLMLAEDLLQVEQVLLNEHIAAEIDKRHDIEAVLQRCKEVAVDHLLTLGIHIEFPNLTVIEKLPPPYAGPGVSAFVADQGDLDFYNIKPGIYFARNRLRPFYSEFLLAHELVHVVLSRINPDLSARGLEEGLAELMGSMYLSSKMLGKDMTTNLFVYSRLSYGQQQFWELYLDGTRQATLLYHRFGLRGMVQLLNSGREKLKEVERLCLRMEFDAIDLPKGHFDDDLTTIADFLSLAFCRNLVVSPLAKYLTRFVRPERTIADILLEANVDWNAGLGAMRELKSRVNLVSFLDDSDDIANERIRRTDCDRLKEGAFIRYELPEYPRT